MMDCNISDIAKTAGVSRATVSRVMNGNPAVKPKTAAHVREVMEKLGYVRPAIRPGPKPRTIHTNRLRATSIALITIGGTSQLFQEPIMTALIGELQSACRKRQLNLLLDQMTSPDQIPLCVEGRQIDGAIIMIAGTPPLLRECIAKLASLIPVVHIFTPGHPLSTVDHVTVNDVAVGDMAFRTLMDAGCKSLALVNANPVFLEALHVRGRAFGDRAAEAGVPLHFFTRPTSTASPKNYWPQPLTVFEDFKTLASAIRSMPKPVGVFLTLESHAPQLHAALREEGLLDDGSVKLAIAGTTPFFVKDLQPAPLLIDLSFSEIIEVAVDRLIHRANHMPSQILTFLVPPKIAGS